MGSVRKLSDTPSYFPEHSTKTVTSHTKGIQSAVSHIRVLKLSRQWRFKSRSLGCDAVSEIHSAFIFTLKMEAAWRQTQILVSVIAHIGFLLPDIQLKYSN